jgi:hypothetical protein
MPSALFIICLTADSFYSLDDALRYRESSVQRMQKEVHGFTESVLLCLLPRCPHQGCRGRAHPIYVTALARLRHHNEIHPSKQERSWVAPAGSKLAISTPKRHVGPKIGTTLAQGCALAATRNGACAVGVVTRPLNPFSPALSRAGALTLTYSLPSDPRICCWSRRVQAPAAVPAAFSR